jgi:subtilisin family serine protease
VISHRLRTALLLTVTSALLGVLVVYSGASAQDSSAGTDPPLLPSGRTYTVTLLTGDVVTVHTQKSGCPAAVSVRPADPSGVLHRSCDPDGRVRVVPGDVVPLLGDVLDESLFDITTLIAEGYDDASTDELPLVVRPASGTVRTAAVTADLREVRDLPSIGAVAGGLPKAEAARFTSSLSAGADGPATRSTGPAAVKVWLDHRVRVTEAPTGSGRLDTNLAQVAAPQAWATGHNGRGVRVAVLDTGVDPSHPDVRGQVTERADFTVEDGDAVDGHGHGTHVAALIAGTGVASHGQRRGIAPGASLLAGKVLDDQGFGSTTQVIAGMEWAAPRADIVNLSLGGFVPSDGTDPMSLALDALTDEHGTLFVVAAGNDPTDQLITAPAAAAGALTVGAVDADDQLAWFSGRGPLVNTYAAKPEVVAPGVDIVSARAAGTGMGRVVDDHYTAASGTSMAAPHVAGAAALLRQRHPDWTAARLKAGLVGAANSLAGTDPYTVGAGRLHAARSLDGVVTGAGLVNLGTVTYPQSGVTEAKLSWTNTGNRDADVALSVAVADRHGAAAPPGAVTLSDEALSLARGATGTAVLRVDRGRFAGAPGLYTAVVTARSGGIATTTLLAFRVQPPSYDLTLSMTALPDTSPEASVFAFGKVINLDDPALYSVQFFLDPHDPLQVRVPAGRYSVTGSIWHDDWFEGTSRMVLAGDPDVMVDADTSVVLDGAAATPATMTIDGVATEAVAVGVYYEQRAQRGAGWSDFAYSWGENARTWSTYATPMDEPEVGEFQAYTVAGLRAPGDGQPSPYLYDLIVPHDHGLPADLSYRVTSAEQATLARIDQRFHRLDREFTVTDHKRYGVGPSGALISETATQDVSGDRVDYVSPGFAWIDEAFYDGVVTQEGVRRYEPGSRQEKVWVRQPLRPDWYDDPAPVVSSCAPAPVSRTSGNLHVELVDLADGHDRCECLGEFDSWRSDTTRLLTLYHNGKKVDEHPESFGDFTIPAAVGTYRLTYDLDTSMVLPVSTRVSTEWTFRSAGPSGTGRVPVALLSVDCVLPLDGANRPDGGVAEFTVHQTRGVEQQEITSFELWTSVDDGATWQPVPVAGQEFGRYTAAVPQPDAGQAVSLRVAVEASGGSGFGQTIIRAYRAG